MLAVNEVENQKGTVPLSLHTNTFGLDPLAHTPVGKKNFGNSIYSLKLSFSSGLLTDLNPTHMIHVGF